MASPCSDLAAGLNPSCADKKRPGGYNARVYIYQIADLDAYTIDGTSKDILTLSMQSGKKLYEFFGKKMQNDANIEITKGENTTAYNQKVGLKLYAKTSLQHATVENLIEAEDLGFFLQSNAGIMESFGLDTEAGAVGDPAGGLNFENGNWAGGKLINDATGYTLLFSGDMTHSVRQFKTATSTGIGDEITYLAALL